MAEADAALARLHQRVAEGPRLRGDADVAEVMRHRVEARDEEHAGARHIVADAEAIGSDDAHAPRARGDRRQPLLLRLALGKPGLGIARGIDDDAADTG